MNHVDKPNGDEYVPDGIQLQQWILGTLLGERTASRAVKAIYGQIVGVFPYFGVEGRLLYFWLLAILPLRDEGLIGLELGSDMENSRIAITPRGRRYYVALLGLANSLTS